MEQDWTGWNMKMKEGQGDEIGEKEKGETERLKEGDGAGLDWMEYEDEGRARRRNGRKGRKKTQGNWKEEDGRMENEGQEEENKNSWQKIV